jgi:hypothetical protein
LGALDWIAVAAERFLLVPSRRSLTFRAKRRSETGDGGGLMSDNFEIKIRSAAVAGWWTLLIAVGIFLIQWIICLLVVPAQTAWVLTLWGPGATWHEVRSVWFWFLVGFKVFLLLLAFVLVWLTLWARQLRKRTGKPARPLAADPRRL